MLRGASAGRFRGSGPRSQPLFPFVPAATRRGNTRGGRELHLSARAQPLQFARWAVPAHYY